MQKNIVWKPLQAFVENTRLAAGLTPSEVIQRN
jgi:hypothetical protein